MYADRPAGPRGLTPVKLALAGVAVTLAAQLGDQRHRARRPRCAEPLPVLVRRLAGRRTAPTWCCAGAAVHPGAAPCWRSPARPRSTAWRSATTWPAALGRRLGLVRLQGAPAVTLLTGAAVAAIGPVVFVGLVVPHLARAWPGGPGRDRPPLAAADCRRCSRRACCSAADIARPGRRPPVEIQAGLLVAFIGGPFFIVMVRRRGSRRCELTAQRSTASALLRLPPVSGAAAPARCVAVVPGAASAATFLVVCLGHRAAATTRSASATSSSPAGTGDPGTPVRRHGSCGCPGR